MSEKIDIHESKEKSLSTYSFQQSYFTISYEVIKATSISQATPLSTNCVTASELVMALRVSSKQGSV